MTLEVQSRDAVMKAKNLLKGNLIPMEFYGKGVENKSLQVDYQTFRKLFRVAGSNTVLELNVDGGKEKLPAIVHHVHYDPITDKIAHVDFMNVRMDVAIHATVPVELVGMSPAVKEEAGILMHHLHEVEIKCLPKDLIHNIEVDIAPLVDFHTTITVADLQVPEAVEITNNPEDVVANVAAPKTQEQIDAEEAETAAAIEAVGAEEGEEGAADAAAEGGDEKKEESSE